MLSIIFPGQGSQKKGMGKELFKKYRKLVNAADEILGYSIEKLCILDPEGQLDKTEYTQPALYTVNCLSYLDRMGKKGEKPDYLAGHSLGEYCALFAAGVFDFETGLKLVKKRGEIMSLASGGAMAAIIGLDADAVRSVIDANHLEHIQIANLNADNQIVISGESQMVKNSRSFFEDAGARAYIALNVSGAFHSKLMKEAGIEFSEYLNNFEFKDPEIPVISNLMARPYESGEVKRMLAGQITGSVNWVESIRYLKSKGVTRFVEVGSGNVLMKLLDRIEVVSEQPTVSTEKTEIGDRVGSMLGSEVFKKRYQVNYAYATGAMYKGVASAELVIEGAKNGLLSFFGAGGLSVKTIEEAVQTIKKTGVSSYGMNLLHNPDQPEMEEELVDLYLKYNVPNIELAAFMNITPALARLRIKTLKEKEGRVVSIVNLMAKLSRPEVAEVYLRPVPEKMIEKLLDENKITLDEAQLAKRHSVADDICAEADSGGHTDGASAFALLPSIQSLRDRMMKEYKYEHLVHVGLGGGIGTPQAAAAAFTMGADFILTGSVNQCTVEAGTSEAVKDILQEIDVQNTEYAPAGDMFELGAKVQVAKRGILFPARANRLYELYKQHNSIEEIDQRTRKQLEERYFGRTLEAIYKDCREYWGKTDPGELKKAEKNPKAKMAMIFKWYFGFSTKAALSGHLEEKVNFQIHCGPALGSFNQWVKDTPLENWKNRSVGKIGRAIMENAEKVFTATAHSVNARGQS